MMAPACANILLEEPRGLPALERAQIAARWSSADHFYQERDDRTERHIGDLAAYAHYPVEIWVDPYAATDITVQRITLVAANLTARWARHVRIVLSADATLAPPLARDGARTLAERIAEEMRSADPFGVFAIVEVAEQCTAERAEPLRLFVGPWLRGVREMAPQDYHVHAVSWTALGRRCGTRTELSDVSNTATVAAAGLAGSLGAADLFKRAIGHPADVWMSTFAWDTWNSSLALGPLAWSVTVPHEVTPFLDFGKMLVAGVGAIGSAFIYLADMTPNTGELTLFDRDRVEATNLNRSPLFTVRHALESAEKTAAVADYLQGRGPRVVACTGEWRNHGSAFAEEPFDVWISLTNEDGAWAELPFKLPPLVLHGTTTSGWGLSAGRHIPGREDCTLCRMPRPSDAFRGPCAQGDIPSVRDDPTPTRASLPFLSTAAAALLLATFEQLAATPSFVSLPNDVSADLGAGLRAVIALNRGPTPGCRGCAALRSSAWKRDRARGRFTAYSL